MHLPTLGWHRPFPVADRTRTGDLYETEHPRFAALRLCREKISENRAGLDPYDASVFVLVARPHEIVWARRMLNLVGLVIGEADEPGGGTRYRAILETDARAELHCDSPHPPIKHDEPLASRSVDAPPEALMHVVHPDQPHLELVPPDPPVELSSFRSAMERARQAAALRVDCGCGAPAGQVCRCSDEQRLASAAANRNEVH